MEAYSASRTLCQEAAFIAWKCGSGPRSSDEASRRYLFHGREGTRQHRFGDQGERGASLQGGNGCPATGALLPGGIQDALDQRNAICFVICQNVAGDLDQVRIEFAAVPFAKACCISG